MHKETALASDGFPELVERARQAANGVCAKAKLVLRPLLPGVEALKKGNAHFSPRLMLLMLSRTGEELAPDDRKRLQEILEYAEAFQPQLTEWLLAVRDEPADADNPANRDECTRAIDRMTKDLSDLDLLVAKVGEEPRPSERGAI